MKRFAILLLVALLLFSISTAGFTASLPYIGNKTTKVYHTAECTWGQKIDFDNRIYFNSRENAENRGYRRCHYCGDDLVEPGHGGGAGNGSGSNSGSSNGGSSSSQTTVGRPQNKTRTVWEDIWEIVRMILIIVCAAASPVIISLPFSVIYQIVIWLKNKKRQKTSSSNATEGTTSQIAHKPTFPKSKAAPNRGDGPRLPRSATISYDDGTLYLTLANGHKYAYQNVPKTLYEELLASPSRGQFLKDKIQVVYPYYRVE